MKEGRKEGTRVRWSIQRTKKWKLQNYKVEYNFVRNCFKKNDNNKCDSELNIEEMVL